MRWALKTRWARKTHCMLKTLKDPGCSPRADVPLMGTNPLMPYHHTTRRSFNRSTFLNPHFKIAGTPMSLGPQCLGTSMSGIEYPFWLGPECPGPECPGPESPTTEIRPLDKTP